MTDDRNPYDKLREKSQEAEREMREALLSVSDEDEVSGLIEAVGTLAKANLRATQPGRERVDSDRVEIASTALGRIAGKPWAIIKVAFAITVLFIAALVAWSRTKR